MHAHFGLTAWPALAAPGRVHAVTLHGTDLRHPRSRIITRLVLPRLDLVATVSSDLAAELSAAQRRRAVVLPCGVATDRFLPIERAQARTALGLDAGETSAALPRGPGAAGQAPRSRAGARPRPEHGC